MQVSTVVPGTLGDRLQETLQAANHSNQNVLHIALRRIEPAFTVARSLNVQQIAVDRDALANRDAMTVRATAGLASPFSWPKW